MSVRTTKDSPMFCMNTTEELKEMLKRWKACPKHPNSAAMIKEIKQELKLRK